MASYEYACALCLEVKTIIASINETPEIPKCSTCDTDMVRRFGMQTIIFKGNGWGKDA